MSIKKLTKIDQKLIPYNGSSIEFAFNWNAISSSGTTGTVTNLTYSSEFSPPYYAYVAVYLTAGITYSSTFGDGMMSDVYLFDSAGNKVASGTMNQETWEYTHMSYTPEADGTFYIRFQQDYFDPNYPEVTVNLSPRPNTPTDRPLYYPWETSEGLNQGKYPIPYASAREAGVYFDGTPLIGTLSVIKFLIAWGNIDWPTWDFDYNKELDHSIEYDSLIAAVTDSGERIIYSSSEESKMGFSYEDAGFGRVTKVLNLSGYGFQFTNSQDIRSWRICFAPTSFPNTRTIVFRAGNLVSLFLGPVTESYDQLSLESSVPEGVSLPNGYYGALDQQPETPGSDYRWVFFLINHESAPHTYHYLHFKTDDTGNRVYAWKDYIDRSDGWSFYKQYCFTPIPPMLIQVDRGISVAVTREPTGLSSDEQRGGTIQFKVKGIFAISKYGGKSVTETNHYDREIILPDDKISYPVPGYEEGDKYVYIGGWGGQDWTGLRMRFYMSNLRMSTAVWDSYQLQRVMETAWY